MKRKNRITLALMVSSIILLVLFQVLWLVNSYEKAYMDLRKETSRLFRSHISALRDSAFF